MSEPKPIPHLVAHRGYMLHYPENTLPGLAAALEAGACFIEFDIQLSADQVPVVLHDASLLRTAGRPERIFDLEAAAARRIVVGERKRLGDRFPQVTVPLLAEVVELLQDWPRACAFVEIKRASLKHAGCERVLQRVLETIAPVRDRCVIISFDAKAVEQARVLGAAAVGWVFERWDAGSRAIAERIAPEFLFSDHLAVPKTVDRLWPGPWKWALYDIIDPELAIKWAERGAELIETMAIGEILRDARLRRGCEFDAAV